MVIYPKVLKGRFTVVFVLAGQGSPTSENKSLARQPIVALLSSPTTSCPDMAEGTFAPYNGFAGLWLLWGRPA